MKKIFITALWLLFFVVNTAVAQTEPCHLNIVNFPMQEEAWVATDSAEVFVTVQALLQPRELNKIHQSLDEKLKKLSPQTKWHVISFRRYQDNSELERVNANAQTRLLMTELAHLRQRANLLSKPGLKFRISDIKYVPSLAQIEAVKRKLRLKIYKMAQEELVHLNKLYPNQRYYLHQITFDGLGTKLVSNALTTAFAKLRQEQAKDTQPIEQKIVMIANVQFASRTHERN